MGQFDYYNYLGFHNPYVIVEEEMISTISSFNDSVAALRSMSLTLDYSGVVQVLTGGFCYGDRTLIRNLWKTPWLAKPSTCGNRWDYFSLDERKHELYDKRQVAATFYNLVEDEIRKYISGHKYVGILLTGGMDSRIVAAALKRLMEKGKIADIKIKAYTWGHESSRDVVYAQHICKMYSWEWKHLKVDENQMWENCKISVDRGCEYTPIHLHAMSQLKSEIDLDCVLAGSFGDSIGRAEFSGRKVTSLKGIDESISKSMGLLRDDYLELVNNGVRADIQRYHDKFPQKLRYQQLELDHQLHYMRRMLNACMSVINDHIPLYQVFSSPSVYNYVWSLDPSLRTDEVYLNILEFEAPELLRIPWARTGLTYPKKEGMPDQFRKRHHDYGKMIRECFLDYIVESVNANVSLTTSLFNIRGVNQLVKNIKESPIEGSYVFEEKLLYVAQVLNFVERFNLEAGLAKSRGGMFTVVKENAKYKARYLRSKLKK